MSILLLDEDLLLQDLPFEKIDIMMLDNLISMNDILIISENAFRNNSFSSELRNHLIMVGKNSFIDNNILYGTNLLLLNEFSMEELYLLLNLIDNDLIVSGNFCMFFSMKSSIGIIDYTIRKIEGFLRKVFPDLSNLDNFRINIVSRELLTNAVRHGNKLDPNKLALIGIYADTTNNKIRILFSDEGSGFTFPENIESISDLREEKRGMFIVKSYTEELISSGNKIIVSFSI